MRKLTLMTAAIAAMGIAVASPTIASAANARHPYRNVNHANDKGNRPGDAETAKLNQQSLDQAKASLSK